MPAFLALVRCCSERSYSLSGVLAILGRQTRPARTSQRRGRRPCLGRRSRRMEQPGAEVVAVLFFLTMIWAVGYMVAYPGLGSWKALLGWSQTGQYEEEDAGRRGTLRTDLRRFAEMEFARWRKSPTRMELGASLYASYCTTCHGSDARGATGFPNLTDDDWLWGEPEAASPRPFGRDAQASCRCWRRARWR